jgi:hypothetical protein
MRPSAERPLAAGEKIPDNPVNPVYIKIKIESIPHSFIEVSPEERTMVKMRRTLMIVQKSFQLCQGLRQIFTTETDAKMIAAVSVQGTRQKKHTG